MIRRYRSNRQRRLVAGASAALALTLFVTGCQPLLTPTPAAEPDESVGDARIVLTDDQQGIVAAVKDDMAAQTGAAPNAIKVVAIDEVTWSDASLGCPQPDMVYAQVLTPGYLITLDHDGVIFTYHTARGADAPFVLCAATQ